MSGTTTLVQVFTCGCRPDFTYKSRQSFYNHKKSDRHIYWQTMQDNHHYVGRIVELENELSSLKIERGILLDTIIQLRNQQPQFMID